MKKLLILMLSSAPLFLPGQTPGSQFTADFDYCWSTIDSNYCYWGKKQTDWEKVKRLYGPKADTITSRASFVSLLEKMLYEIYDHHASLNTNTAESQRLVPSGTDLWASYVGGKPTLTEVRRGSGAAQAGMIAGMHVIAVNDVPVEMAIQPFLPKCLVKSDAEARNYALRVVLAGRHSENRKITVEYLGRTKDFFPDEPVNLLEKKNDVAEVQSQILRGNIGYILINNSLGENALIPLFDSVLNSLMKTRAVILDLRSTPSGGNTSVARSILGRFISHEGYYQKHELTVEGKESGIKRSWVEIVSPKKPTYQHRLIVLVDHWTGSVGEGIAVGFDALKRATVIGTKMAGLNGAVYSFTMPNTGIGFTFPVEKLFHVNGTPRENFTPAKQVDMMNRKVDADPILKEALRWLSQDHQ